MATATSINDARGGHGRPILVTGAAGFIGANFVLEWLGRALPPVVSLDKLTYAGNLNFKVEHGLFGPPLVPGATELPAHTKLHLVAIQKSDAATANALSTDTNKPIDDCFLRLAALPTFPLDSQPLRTSALAADPSARNYTGIVAPAKVTAETLKLSVLVWAQQTRAWPPRNI